MTKAVMTSLVAVSVAMAAGAQTPASPPVKVGVVNMQAAIIGTKDGQKAAAELENEMAPRRKDVEAKQAEINGLKDQLQKGANTLSDQAREDLMHQIDEKGKRLDRTMEDDRAELQQEQERLLRSLEQKMYVVIGKYALDNGFAVILDDSSPQTPVMWTSNAIEVTKDLIDLYDKNAGAMATPNSSGAAHPAGPVTPRPSPGTPSGH